MQISFKAASWTQYIVGIFFFTKHSTDTECKKDSTNFYISNQVQHRVMHARENKVFY